MSTIIAPAPTKGSATKGGKAVRISLDVCIPTSADAGFVLATLHRAASLGHGVTIVMPDGKYNVDVDLIQVEEVLSA